MFKQNFKKLCVLCLGTVMAATVSLMDVKAANAPAFDCSLLGGLGEYGEVDRYWYFEGYDMYYLACAQEAFNAWQDTSVNGMANYISFERTGEELKAHITVALSSDGSDVGYNGYTRFTFNGSDVYPNYSVWDRARLVYNTTNGNINEYCNHLITGIMCHEIGHAFGLDENNGNTNSIMCQWIAGRAVSVPTSNDIWSAIAIYVK